MSNDKGVILQNLRDFTVQIRHPKTGAIVGTGIVVSNEGHVVTCAHVLTAALKCPPSMARDKEVGVYFPQVSRKEDKEHKARLVGFFPDHDDDVVLLQLTDKRVPLGPEQIAVLGNAELSQGNPFRSYGYRRLGKYVAGIADGRIQGCIESPEGFNLQVEPVQLQSQNIGPGMSGSAVLDTERNLVVGLISEQYNPPKGFADRDTGYAVNAQVLTFDPIKLTVQTENLPKRISAVPVTPIEAQLAYTARFEPAWNNAPSPLDEWVGRVKLLEQLSADWADPETKVTGLIGFGGEGKSSLARKWVDNLLAGDKNTPEGVFWWGFYTKQSVDEFFEAALKYITGGKVNPRQYPSTNAKMHYIAATLAGKRFLFVLDGLEVLQHQDGDNYGSFTSKDLQKFLEYVADPDVKSFCLITSRAPALDLMKFTSYKHRDVDRLFKDDGRALLKKLGVIGKDAELDKMVENWDGHALTLSLLGSCIAKKHGGDISKAADIELPEVGEDRYQRVHRILRRYDEHMNDAERAFMTLFSAFRIPVKEIAFEKVFLTKTAATAINAPIGELSREQFDAMIKRLQSYRMLRYDDRDKNYTAHPLIRDHYVAILTKSRKKDQKDAHKRIKDYYLAITGATPPYPTLDDLTPLIEVVYHLCHAGAYDEAQKIMLYRIDQEDRWILTHVLGAYEVGLTLLRQLFPNGDMKFKPQVSKPRTEAAVLCDVGYYLMKLGRLDESGNFVERGVWLHEYFDEYESISIGYGNLSQLYADQGKLEIAKDAAQKAIAAARTANCSKSKSSSMTRLAWTSYLLGDMTLAGEYFKQVESVGKEIDPDNAYLYGVRGIFHADHLRRVKEINYARKVAITNLAICKLNCWPADISQCHRVLGDLDADEGKHKSAQEHYDEALKIARSIADRALLIKVLLARGRWYAKYMNDPQAAFSDLNEALDYATDGGYRIYEADIRIALAWAYLRDGNPDRAKAEVQRALHMSEEMGYHWGKVDAQEVLQELEKQK